MERFARQALGLLLGQPDAWPASARLSDGEWQSLLRLAERNVIVLRLHERLQALGAPVPHAPWAAAVDAERARIRSTLELIRRLTEICEASSVDYVLTKSFQHVPDMGHDVDLFVLDRSQRVDDLLRERLGAVPGAWSLVHRVAGKLAYTVPGYPSPVEVHHGRLGLLGEHVAYPALLVRRRELLQVDGVRAWIPSREDRLIVQALQRIYTHFSLRLSDVLHSVLLIRLPDLDWDYVVSTASAIGIADGLACYLRYVREIHSQSGGAALDMPGIARLAAPKWAGSPSFSGHQYRFPVAAVLVRVYAAKLLADMKTRNWRGIGKLALLLPLGLAVGVRNVVRMKRALDVTASALGLAVLAPLLLLVGALVKWEDGGPVLYRSIRAGLGGRPFGMLKFRTMVVNADRIGPPSTADDDPRITRVGRLLRKYKLDELPQLLNVLRGEMSLVGPRPEVLSEVEQYVGEERLLLSVLPGMTDWASLRFRNEGEILQGSPDPHRTYREKIRPEKIRLGLEYVYRRSLWVDLKILVCTALMPLGLGVRREQ